MAPVKTRRLGDLFKRGKLVPIIDGEQGDTVWVQKLNPVETDKVLRKANAARAIALGAFRNEDSEEYLAISSDILAMTKEDLVDFLTADELAKQLTLIEAETAEEKGWNKDEYLQGLYDAWNGDEENPGLREVFEDDSGVEEDDPKFVEARRVQSELDKFNEEVMKRVEQARERLQKEHQARSEDVLRKKLSAYMFKIQGDLRWALEYRKSQLLYAVRVVDPTDTDNHRTKYFASREEIDELSSEVVEALTSALNELEVGVEEGKDLPEIPASSSQSDSPETPEVENSSSMESITV